jgi:hypothetical protein
VVSIVLKFSAQQVAISLCFKENILLSLNHLCLNACILRSPALTSFIFCTTTLVVLAFSAITFQFKAILDLFCPFYKFHPSHVIPDSIFPTRLGSSYWTTCKWFPFFLQHLFLAIYLCVRKNSMFEI